MTCAALLLLLALAAPGALAQLPDARRTPGAADPRVTPENIHQTVCVPGYPATVRPPSSYTSKLKREQISLWGLADADPDDYEEDHLVSIELGGAPRDPRNLWPQRWDGCGAHRKDVLENKLHRLVCEGVLGLREAQRAIASDWVSAYRTYVDKELCP